MNLKQIQDEVAAQYGLSKAAAGRIAATILDKVTESLTTDKRFRLGNIGILKVKDRAERTCKNPKTGVEIKVSARKVATFTPSKKLKETLNK